MVEVEPTLELEDYLRRRLPAHQTPIKDPTLIWSEGVRTFLVDSVGMMMKGPFAFDGLPDVHVGFWDKVLVGREAMARSLAARIASEAGVPGVFTAMPRGSRATLAFAKRVGFKQVQENNQIVVLTLLFT